jgi:hypothetical protein
LKPRITGDEKRDVIRRPSESITQRPLNDAGRQLCAEDQWQHEQQR